MSKPHTHVFNHTRQPLPNIDQFQYVTHCYRLSDGLRLGTVKDVMAQFGPDPQQAQMRVFMDRAYALGFLRKLADRDWAMENGLDPAAADFNEKAAAYAAEIRDAGDPLAFPSATGNLIIPASAAVSRTGKPS